jgi:MFS transporter, DHA1 family, inner membrane transport protein
VNANPATVPSASSSVSTPSARSRPASAREWAGPVAVLALGTFAMGTDSFVLAGILPQISAGLHTSAGAAGQVVTVFALAYGLAAPFLSAATSRIARRPLLAVALGLFVLANLGSALAPSIAVLLAARIAAGLGAALYTPTASAAAAALAGNARRGQALAVILGGMTVGPVFGVPVGTAIGQHVSWRAALVYVAGVGALALLGLLVIRSAPPLPPVVSWADRLRVFAHGRVIAIVLVMTLASGSSIMVYTYIADVLGGTAQIRGTALAAMLLLWGVGGTVGAFGSGWSTDRWGAERTLTLAIGGLAVSLALLAVAPDAVTVAAVLLCNGAAGWAVSTPNNHRLIALAPGLPSVVISFNSSGIYLGQALGAGVGGLLLAGGVGVRGLCLIGAGVALAAGAVNLAWAGRVKNL